jgi:uncharacterized protein (DUF169 family)
MQSVNNLYNRLQKALGLEEAGLPVSYVKLYKNDDVIPSEVFDYHPDEVTLTSCQAARQASLGDAVCLTRNNIGCIAAAISFGLVDQNDDKPFERPRVYTELMRNQSKQKDKFIPPSPRDFTEGLVYACKESGHQEFCLFGEKDSGRFKDLASAKQAVSEMIAIQPATMKAVFFFSTTFDAIDIIPDVIVFNIRPVELMRFVQAYQFITGKRVLANMGGLRSVNSDLIVRPYLTQELNISAYCLGSRIIASYEANRLGLGIPYKLFEEIVIGMEKSKTGYPFNLYPGAIS